jgi:hypothetical protein
MRIHTPVGPTSAPVEQLLADGWPPDLCRLLAAAAGPGTANDLAGEAAATAAFVSASHTPLPSEPPRRPSMFSTAVAKILAAKVLTTVVLVAGASGGIALAASATSEPADSSTSSARTTPGARPSESPASPETGGPDGPGGETGATGPVVSKPEEQPAGPPTGVPDPSLAGLCRAWIAGAADNPGKAADNPAFAVLIAAAGDAGKVPAYCALAGTTAPDRPDPAPGKSADAPGQAGEPGQKSSVAVDAPDSTEDKTGPATEANPHAGHESGRTDGSARHGDPMPGR